MKLSILKGGKGSKLRGVTEAGLVVVLAVAVAGVLLKSGLAPTSLSTSDGLTWLGDDARGEAVQVNPATGQQENRLRVAPTGHDLDIAQRDGLLVVTDTTTGTVTVIDVATLITGGRWFGSDAGSVKVLLSTKDLYVVDRARGTVQRIDPVSARPVGAAWSAGGLIADATVDGAGEVWALRGDGRLFTLGWQAGSAMLAETTPSSALKGAGPRSLVIGHDRGVTVFAPESGVATQVGTGDDSVVETGGVQGIIQAASQTPSDLVPVAAPDAAKVLLLRRGQAIVVDTAAMGCRSPGEPVVFHDRVYVSCPDAHKVLVLSRNGDRRPPDITVPSGAPKLVVDDGRLFIHVSGGDKGLVVGPDGSIAPTETHDESQPVADPDHRPSPSIPQTKPPRRDPTTGTGPGAPGTPPPSPTPPAPTAPPGPSVPGAPSGVGIAALFEFGTTLRVEASWQAPADNGSAITGFALVLTTDRGYSNTLSPTALRSGAIDIPCGSRCHGIQVRADVRAANGQGQGPLGQATYSHNAPGVSPADGEAIVTSVTVEEASRTAFYVDAVINPSFAWRTYEGTCTFNYSGPTTGSRALSCWATSLTFTFIGGNGTYRFWVQAGGIKSNEFGVLGYHEPPEPAPCPTCPIP